MMLVHRVFRSMTGPFWRQFLPRTRARAWVFFRRGDEARDSRRWGEAVQFYERGLELCPNRFAFWVQLGHVLKESTTVARRGCICARSACAGTTTIFMFSSVIYIHCREMLLRHAGIMPGQWVLGSRDHHALHFLARIP